MKKTFMAITTAMLAVSLPGTAQAQSSASATATGSTTLFQPISIAKTSDMSFGRLVKPATGSVYVVLFNESGAINPEPGLQVLDAGSVARAVFTIAGEGGELVSISVPPSFTMSNGANTIAVTLEPNEGGVTTLSGSAGSSGNVTLGIGANFVLPSTQATGFYSGSFTVSVAYQ